MHEEESVVNLVEEITSLRQEVERLRGEMDLRKPKRIACADDLEIGEQYFVVNAQGDVEAFRCAGDTVDEIAVRRHRAFATQEDAVAFRNMTQAVADLMWSWGGGSGG